MLSSSDIEKIVSNPEYLHAKPTISLKKPPREEKVNAKFFNAFAEGKSSLRKDNKFVLNRCVKNRIRQETKQRYCEMIQEIENTVTEELVSADVDVLMVARFKSVMKKKSHTYITNESQQSQPE